MYFLGSFALGTSLAYALHAVGWYLRLRKAMRFIVERGCCQSHELPVMYPHLTASRLGERGWVQSCWEYGTLKATDQGKAASQ
jgi:hypothetical protein